jgi:hypothetical protein
MAQVSVYALVMLSVLAVLSQDVSGEDLWDGPDKIRINASNILDQIREGKDVNCGPDSVIIGDILLDEITNTSIKSDITIHSEIYGKVRASKEFQGRVDLKGATFHEDVSFEDSVFFGSFRLDDASFKGILNLEGAHFDGSSSFGNINCEENAYFYRAIFAGPSYFYNSKFSKLADFSQCKFMDYGEFQHSTFQGRALFRRSTFAKETTFRGSEFAMDVEFNGANFSSDAIFASVKCEGTLNFNEYSFIKSKNTEFNGNLSLEDSRIRHIDLKDATLSSRSLLNINNCDFYKLDARWVDIQNHILFDEEAYIKLINYYKSVGMFADADACYREYNDESKKPDIFSKAVNWFLWITCYYGTIAWLAPIYLAILSIIFAALYRYPTPKIKIKINDARVVRDAKKDESKQEISFYDTLYFSSMKLVNSSTDYVPIGRWRWAVLLEIIIGWALLAIFIIMIVRLGLR